MEEVTKMTSQINGIRKISALYIQVVDDFIPNPESSNFLFNILAVTRLQSCLRLIT